MNAKTEIKRDVEYIRLASDLRFEAARAIKGESVDQVQGAPTGYAYGSFHEYRLKSDATYREDFTVALLATADKAQARGELGEPATVETNPPRKTVLTTIRDPMTGEPLSRA